MINALAGCWRTCWTTSAARKNALGGIILSCVSSSRRSALAERKAIYGLQFQGEQPKQRKERNTTHRYHFEPQEVSIEAGDQLHEIMGEIFEDEIGTVRFIDPAAGIIDIKKRGAAIDKHPTGRV